jgi:hypothetical protein
MCNLFLLIPVLLILRSIQRIEELLHAHAYYAKVKP